MSDSFRPHGLTIQSMEFSQARILEWVAYPSSRGSSQSRDQTQVSHIAGGFFTTWATREAQSQQTNSLLNICLTFSQGYCLGLPRWLSGKECACQHRRCRFDPWFGKIPWRRKWQPTPAVLPEKSHGQRSLVGYSSWGHKRLGHNLVTKTTTIVSNPCKNTHIHTYSLHTSLASGKTHSHQFSKYNAGITAGHTDLHTSICGRR